MCRSRGARIHTLPKRLFGLGVAVALVGWVALGHQAIAKQLGAWDLLPQPEPFTEFYFTDPSMALTPGKAQVVGLTIQSHQKEPTTYHYTITAAPGGAGPQTLQEGGCTAEPNGSCQIAESVAVPLSPIPILLRATIEYQGRTAASAPLQPLSHSVHYWIKPNTKDNP